MTHVSVGEVDLDTIVDIHGQIPEFGGHQPRDHFESRIGDSRALVTAGYADGIAAGYLLGYDRDGDGSFYVWMAGVLPDHRQQGVLSSLMEYQSQWAKESGYNTLRIKTRNNRREMLRFLVKQGFYFTEVMQREHLSDYRIALERPL